MQRISVFILSLAMASGVSLAHEIKLESLQLVHPWARGQAVSGITAPRDVSVFLTMFNRGAYPDRLIAVSSPLAATGELRDGPHATEAIAFGPASPVKMGFDGPHVVLRGVTDDLAGYEAFPVWLTFEKAGRVEVSVFVEDAAIKEPSCSGSLMPSEMPKSSHDHEHDQHTH